MDTTRQPPKGPDAIPPKYEFILYVAGRSPNSTAAERNIYLFCERHLQGKYQIEIIDVFDDPQKAIDDSIRITPVLLIRSPHPGRKIYGNLSDEKILLQELGLVRSNSKQE